MKLIFIACLTLACVIAQAQTATLTADTVTGTHATHCGGYINGVRIANVPLQASAPRCKLVNPPGLMYGGNSWKACNSAPNDAAYSEGCNDTVLNFSLTQAPAGPTPLSPPTNLKMVQQ